MSKRRNRPQKAKANPKVGNEEYMRGMQELRRSNAEGTHRAKTDYRRKPKHGGWGE